MTRRSMSFEAKERKDAYTLGTIAPTPSFLPSFSFFSFPFLSLLLSSLLFSSLLLSSLYSPTFISITDHFVHISFLHITSTLGVPSSNRLLTFTSTRIPHPSSDFPSWRKNRQHNTQTQALSFLSLAHTPLSLHKETTQLQQ